MSFASSGATRRTHLVPTRLKTPQPVLTVASISLSAPQFLLLLVGVALSYRVWLALGGLAMWTAGMVARWILAGVPTLLALLLAFVRLADRDVTLWCVVVVRFAVRPHLFVWRSIRFHEALGGMAWSEEDADGETI
jgi:hypothetical protein